MSYRDIIKRTWSENHLFSVLLELTYRCNLDCAYCYNDVDAPGKPLSNADYLRLLEDLRDLQTMNLVLTGGEPLAHPDFFLLGQRARELGFVVRVKSNGHALRRHLAQRLQQEVDPFMVEVSIHGATAATHDRQTRTEGSFTRLMGNIQECLALGLRIKFNCTLTAWNEHELEALYALADGLGVPLQVDPRVTPCDNGDRGPLDLTASEQGLLRHFRLQEARSAGPHRFRTGIVTALPVAGGAVKRKARCEPISGAGVC
jgi:MoaA/NifB/PqqE/SkfB family radical SAM enzyme